MAHHNSHATVPVERKLFRTVRVSDPATAPERTLSLLAKERLAGRIIDEIWKAEFIDRQVRDAVGRLFGPEPDAVLVRRIRSAAPAVAPAEVRASLGRMRITFDIPEVTATIADQREGSARPPTRQVPKPSTPPTPVEPKGDGTPWRGVTLAQLVEAGLVRLPLALEHRYKGTQLSARIEAVERIVYDGRSYVSLSLTGGMARKSVVGAPPGRDYPQTNGWTFWQYRKVDGSLGVLDELRRELHEGKVVRINDAGRPGA